MTLLEKMSTGMKADLVEQEREAKRARRGRVPIDYPRLARAALEAIRVPDEGPVGAGAGVSRAAYEAHGGEAGSDAIFTAMIDAILNEKTL